ncbi:hypothetical protein ABS772_13180 [Methylorubrum podarium]|uniref:Uncharacterized protein n=1 Tax=Methylorubrum podarium TaxID=200476 RepID=A0ABV1QNA2_9HYPH
MRNPLKLPTFRRNPDRPTLKARAASLKAGLSRLIQRPAQHAEADQGRRSVMVASVAAAVPLPALAYSPEALAAAVPAPALLSGPHPDQALLDAETNLSRALEAQQAARQAASRAWGLIEDVLREFPAPLVPSDWETALVQRLAAKGLLSGYADMHQVPRWQRAEDGQIWQQVWTGKALRMVIEHAVPVLGQGGQTPHRIKRWRELLPVADIFDARVAAVRTLSDYDRLRDASHAVDAAVLDLRFAISRSVAATADGLAVHVRLLIASDRRRRNTEFEPLLLSAAALTGTDLRLPYFDVPEWVAAWERSGGRIERIKRRYGRPEWGFIYPSFAGASDDFKYEVRQLGEQRSQNLDVISDWLDANR